MRARNLKPGYFKNEQLASLPPFARLLFAGLWGLADRKGRLRDNPRLIAAEIFPYEQHNVEKLLALLAAAKEADGISPAFIIRYEANSSRYIQIVNFDRHQNPHTKEPSSTIPAPGRPGAEHQTQPGAEHRKRLVPSRADSGLRTPDSNTISRESGVEHRTGNGTGPSPTPTTPAPVAPPEEEFRPVRGGRWDELREALRGEIDPREFKSWFDDVVEVEAPGFVVEVRTEVWLEYLPTVYGQALASRLHGPLTLRCGEKTATIEPAAAVAPASTAEPPA